MPSADPERRCSPAAIRRDAMPQQAARSNIHSGISRQRAAASAVIGAPKYPRASSVQDLMDEDPHGQTMDARDRELPALRSGGRYVVELYNRRERTDPWTKLAGLAPGSAGWLHRVA